MHHPWRSVRALVDWTVHWTSDLPPGIDAATRWSDRTIWVRLGLSQVQRRCVIEHERQHVLRGPGGVLEEEERQVDIATARVLVDIDELLDAALWARSLPELADELHVTQDVIHCRLAHLHPAERHALRRAAHVEAVEEAV